MGNCRTIIITTDYHLKLQNTNSKKIKKEVTIIMKSKASQKREFKTKKV